MYKTHVLRYSCPMKKFALLLLSILSFSQFASAGCMTGPLNLRYCGPGDCQKNILGQIECSKYPGGGAMIDLKQVVCGVGRCMRFQNVVWCADTAGAFLEVKYNALLASKGSFDMASNNNCQDGELTP